MPKQPATCECVIANNANNNKLANVVIIIVSAPIMVCAILTSCIYCYRMKIYGMSIVYSAEKAKKADCNSCQYSGVRGWLILLSMDVFLQVRVLRWTPPARRAFLRWTVHWGQSALACVTLPSWAAPISACIRARRLSSRNSECCHQMALANRSTYPVGGC